MTRSSTSLERISRFVVVGTIGFLVDAGCLWLALHVLGLGLYSGRVLSFSLGATATWLLNRSFTYRDRPTHHRLHEQWARYMGASALGALANYAAYVLSVATLGVVVRHPTLGVAAGSLAGLVFNYNSYTRFVFRARRETHGGKPPAARAAPAPVSSPDL